MEGIVGRNDSATGATAGALAQLARELLLLESSDWPFLVTTGQAREYAELRFAQHVERFNTLAGHIESDAVDAAYVEATRYKDNLFADIEFRDFRAREGIVAPATATLR
jgi:1,4-alpha-glucan branching enzyme